MNKYTRFSFFVLVTVILMLAMVIPVLAGGRGGSYFESCYITPPYWDKNGEVVRDRDFKIYGDFFRWYTKDGEIVNECEGYIPLGDEINNTQFTFLDFDEMCSETLGTCESGYYYLDNIISPTNNLVVDPSNKLEYWSPIYVFTIDPVGHFLFVKTYYYP